jgi:hypothetical protein
MPLYIVHNDLRDAIYRKIDKALEEVPDAKSDRDVFYEQLLSYYNEHGRIPDFSITLREQNTIIGKL